MRYKGFGQRSVLDDLLDRQQEKRKLPKNFLSEIDQYIDWGIYRRPIEKFKKTFNFGDKS